MNTLSTSKFKNSHDSLLRLITAMLILLLFSACSDVKTSMPEKRDIGYWRSSTGAVWKTGFGGCWRTGVAATGSETHDSCGKEIAAAPPPEPVDPDSDGDGVPDSIDQCPGTPAGVTVDSRGCPLDSDGDGVPDYLDHCPNTPANTPVDQHGCPLPGTKLFTIEGVNFDFDSANLRNEAQSTLNEAVRVINDNRDVSIAIIGHTDSTGSDAYNDSLSERRAKAVYDYLSTHGVDTSRLRVYGRGENQPIATNETSAGRAENRRVEFIVEE